jgi:UDP-N-acetylmuramate dehydrogenase
MLSSGTWPCAALYAADLADRTTLAAGGSAAWLLEPATPAEFAAAFRAARERDIPVRVLGGGANLIVDEGLHRCVVLTTARMTRLFRAGREQAELSGDLTPPARGEGEPVLVAWGGVPLPGLVRAARELVWTGLEGLVGIPGHVGGGVAMNAGGRWGAMWDVVESVELLTPDGAVVELARADAHPRYRDGNLGGAIVLAARLRLEHGNPEEIRQRMRDYLSQKSAAQPVTERSAGCVFKNPDREVAGGRSAGQLIEAAGGKGLRRGDALVSEKHANFIVNTGRARPRDVLLLIEDVRRQVAERLGIELETEVKIWRQPEPEGARGAV